MLVLKDNEITLQQLQPTHASSIFGLVESNREFLMQYLPWVEPTERVQDTLDFIKFTQTSFQEGRNPTFVIIYESQIAGVCNLHPIDFEHHHVSLGYWIGEKFQGKGIVTRAVKILLKYCFVELNLNKVEIKCATTNLKSCKIPERLGFHFDGILRENELVGTRMLDHRVYSLLQREWQNLSS